MNIHICKQCGSRFAYCRACVFRPIRYKDKGFCSKECYEASKIEIPTKTEIQPIEEEILVVEAEEVFTEDEISEEEEEILTEEVEIEFYENEIEINEEHE